MKKEKRRHLKVKMWWNIVLYTGISNFKTFGSLESHTKIIPQEKPKKGKKTIEELRAERLQREKEERFRAEKLVKESKDGNADKEVEEEDQYRGRYVFEYKYINLIDFHLR